MAKHIVTLVYTRSSQTIASHKKKDKMKALIILILISGLSFRSNSIRSQDLTIRKEIDHINSILGANPYRDTFLEITFHYAIDVTPDGELLVNMVFDGPFKTLFKARIRDLGNSFQRDTAYEGRSSLCWSCIPGEITKDKNCVYNETITNANEKESHYSDNICVMFTMKSELQKELTSAFGNLFRKVLEQR
jgi:hypothetical protein